MIALNTMFSFKIFKQSFKYAYKGLVYVFKNEQSFRLQLLVSVVVILMMLYFQVSRKEAVLLVIVIMNVLVLEMINTAVEKLVDMLKPRIHFYAKIIKNIMATAVLLASVGAVVIGLIVFWPYLVALEL
jgi:diacylglycerol kinase